MIGFEKIEQRERHPSIELSDEMIKQVFIFKKYKIDENTPQFLKEKYDLAESLSKKGSTIDLHHETSLIPMNIEVPNLEKKTKEKGMHPKKQKKSKIKNIK